jgi:hypothetical protein
MKTWKHTQVILGRLKLQVYKVSEKISFHRLLKRHANFSFNTVELGVNLITLRLRRSPINSANDGTQGFQPSTYCTLC